MGRMKETQNEWFKWWLTTIFAIGATIYSIRIGIPIWMIVVYMIMCIIFMRDISVSMNMN